MVWTGALRIGTTGSTVGKVSQASTLATKGRVGAGKTRAALDAIASFSAPFRGLQSADQDGTSYLDRIAALVHNNSAAIRDWDSTIEEFNDAWPSVQQNAAALHAQADKAKALAAELEKAGDLQGARESLQLADQALSAEIEYRKAWQEAAVQIHAYGEGVIRWWQALPLLFDRFAIFMNTWRSTSNQHFLERAVELLEENSRLDGERTALIEEINETNGKQNDVIAKLAGGGGSTDWGGVAVIGLLLFGAAMFLSGRGRR